MFDLTMRVFGRWPILALLATAAGSAQAQTYTKLYEFPGEQTHPQAALLTLADGSMLGTTTRSVKGGGSVFKLTPDGSGGYIFFTLHDFDPATEGAYPTAALIESGGNFYGTTQQGGTYGDGTAFKMTPAGAVTTIHSFQSATDGRAPLAALIQFGGNFYGTANEGGTYNQGTVFEMTPAGAVTTLHSFQGFDGANPTAALIESSGDFYSLTTGGGTYGNGTAFKMTPAGAITTLHSFQSSADGAIPFANLIEFGGNFYGTTYSGGTNNTGTAFEMTPAGTVTTLHSFDFSTEGANPTGALIESGGDFYGTTRQGGTSGDGTAFKMTPAGVVTTLHSFQGYPTEGGTLFASLIESNGNFYGITSNGGANDKGTAFKMTPAGVLTTLHSFQASTVGVNPYAALIEFGGDFYGTTAGGGSYGDGTAFKITPAGIETTLHSFNRATEGRNPASALVESGGDFYGTTPFGGTYGQGTTFKMTSVGVVSVLYSFDFVSSADSGAYPQAALIASGGYFYGTTRNGGNNDAGIVFKMTPAGVVSRVHGLTAQMDGANPQAALIESGGYFYGTATHGGPSITDQGTVFKMQSTGATTVLHSFDAATTGGANSVADLVLFGGDFYGTTDNGGIDDAGTVFKVTPAGVMSLLHTFDAATEGSSPQGALVEFGGDFYGTTSAGGVNNKGTVFKVTPTGVVSVLHVFQGYPVDGDDSRAALLAASNGRLYGTTAAGGGANAGIIFSISLKATTTLVIAASVSNNSSIIGQNYAVSVTVNSGNSPTGSIDVDDGSNNCQIVLPATSCNLPSTGVGSQIVTAIYSGDANNVSSDAGTTHLVLKATPTVVITSDTPDPTLPGVGYTVAASVGGGYFPTGLIVVSDGSQTCTIVLPAANCLLTSITGGPKKLVATFNGNSNNNVAVSSGVKHTVSQRRIRL